MIHEWAILVWQWQNSCLADLLGFVVVHSCDGVPLDLLSIGYCASLVTGKLHTTTIRMKKYQWHEQINKINKMIKKKFWMKNCGTESCDVYSGLEFIFITRALRVRYRVTCRFFHLFAVNARKGTVFVRAVPVVVPCFCTQWAHFCEAFAFCWGVAVLLAFVASRDIYIVVHPAVLEADG